MSDDKKIPNYQHSLIPRLCIVLLIIVLPILNYGYKVYNIDWNLYNNFIGALNFETKYTFGERSQNPATTKHTLIKTYFENRSAILISDNFSIIQSNINPIKTLEEQNTNLAENEFVRISISPQKSLFLSYPKSSNTEIHDARGEISKLYINTKGEMMLIILVIPIAIIFGELTTHRLNEIANKK